MGDVVAWIASPKPSLEFAQEKVQAVLIRCRVMCWTSCSRCVAGHLNLWWALWCRVCQRHHSFSTPCRPQEIDCSEASVNKDVASLDDLPQGSLAHRYTYSSLHELNLTDIFFPKVSCERVYLPSSCSALVGCGWSLLVCLCYSRWDHGFFATARSASTHGDYPGKADIADFYTHVQSSRNDTLWACSLELPLYYQGTAVLIYQSKIWRHGIGSIKKWTFVLSLAWFYRKCSWQITILDILSVAIL